MKKSVVFGSIFVVLIIFGVIFFDEEQDEWGGEGSLSLSITLSTNSTGTDDPINVTYTLTNNGTTNLRVLFPRWFTPTDLITFKDENGSVIQCHIDYDRPPDPINDDLVKVKPGENVTRIIEISTSDYSFENNSQYSVMGQYKIVDHATISRSYWIGEIFSNDENLFIK